VNAKDLYPNLIQNFHFEFFAHDIKMKKVIHDSFFDFRRWRDGDVTYDIRKVDQGIDHIIDNSKARRILGMDPVE
jgi:hypothetical protein